MKLFGIVGWKNSGKTTTVAALVTELRSRGFSVSTVKHAHHAFDLDQPGRDSYKHREAGAQEVLISSGNRWALMHELRDEEEFCLDELLTKMTPVDLILIEGFKKEPHAKIECHRSSSEMPLICSKDDTIIAVATDVDVDTLGLPKLDLNNVPALADYIIKHVGLR